MCKQMAVTFPFAMLLIDFWPLNRLVSDDSEGCTLSREILLTRLKSLIGEKIGMFLLVIVFSLVAYWAQSQGGALRDFKAYPLGQRLLNVPVAYLEYLGKLVWPVDLSFHYQNYGQYPTLPVLIVCCGLMLAISSFAMWQWRRRPYLIVGWLWYLGVLFPLIGLVQVGDHRLADRYTDLPLIGIYMAFVLGARELLERVFDTPRAGLVLGCGLLTLLAWRSHGELGYWRDNTTLYLRALELDPRNPKAINNLAVYYSSIGEDQKAIDLLQNSERVPGVSSHADYNLGCIYGKLGESEKAIAAYQAALAADPDTLHVVNNLAVEHVMLKDYEAAAQLLDSFLAKHPDDSTLLRNRACVSAYLGQKQEALRLIARAIEAEPEFLEARVSYAELLRESGDVKQAEDQLRVACSIDPSNVHVARRLARLLVADSRFEAALECLRESMAVMPNSPELRAEVAYAISRWPAAPKELKINSEKLVLPALDALAHKDPYALDALASVSVVKGDLKRAIELEERSLQLAKAQQDLNLIREIEGRLEQYRRQQRDATEPPSSSSTYRRSRNYEQCSA